MATFTKTGVCDAIPAPASTPTTSFTSVSVIVPTYCEAENIPQLVERVVDSLESVACRGEVIIVDDNSPDDTKAVCSGMAQNYPVRLEVRISERGLSSAVIHGMRLASGDVLVVMDADLSHPPEVIPEMIRLIADENVDLVVGSRYVNGGGTEAGWGLGRWLNSRLATLLAMPLTSLRDPMAGFFAMRRDAFLQSQELDPIGYKILLELLVKSGASSIREVPINFRNRRNGESKLSWREQVNYLRHLKRLYMYKFVRRR
jgi:dolichol-phosphate mannosyltransferase